MTSDDEDNNNENGGDDESDGEDDEPPKKRMKNDFGSSVNENRINFDYTLDQSSFSDSNFPPSKETNGAKLSDSKNDKTSDAQISSNLGVMEFDILDEFFESNDNDNEENCSNDIYLRELDALLDASLENDNSESIASEPQHVEKKKTILKVRGRDHFDVLPEGWIEVTHNSGMPIYLHKPTRVCSVSKPYFLGPGSIRKHEIPITAIPCLHYLKELEKEKMHQEENDKSDTTNDALPSAKLESVKDTKQSGSLDFMAVREYCMKRFEFQTITVKKFKTWSEQRMHQKQLRQIERPTLPDSTKLITCPLPPASDKNSNSSISTKSDFIMNPSGKTPVCILHEYVQHTLKLQPKYIFKELESISTPYRAVVMINDKEYGSGYGSSKKQAKSEAAKVALDVLIPKVKLFNPDEKHEEQQDVEFFDQVRVEDPRVCELSVKAGHPYPYQILRECLKRNYGMGDTEIVFEMRNLKHQKNEFLMTVGKHNVSVICKKKSEGKHRASQSILQRLHPRINSWGSLLRMYGKGSCKTLKEKKKQKRLDLMKTAEAKGIPAPEFRDYMAKMNHNYEETKKDNDFIYHAKISDAKSLNPIGSAPLAKPIMPGEKLNPNSQDMFSALLPVAVQQAMSAFNLRMTEIVNDEKAKLMGETQMLNGILASLNLPAAIEDTTGNCLPSSLKEKSEAVKERGGMKKIQHLLNELPKLLQKNGEILKECERMLNDEKESDNELRSKFGSNWMRTPSSKLNEPLKSNLLKYKNIISTAVSADRIVKEKYDKHRDKIAMLCLPEDQLVSGIPTGNPVSSSSAVEQLKQLMCDVDYLKSERKVLVGELESAAVDMKAKFLSALSSEGGVNGEALSVETLGEMYGPIKKQIRDNISMQEHLVRDIQNANKEFSREKNSGGSSTKRDSMLSDLAAAHDAYMELLGNLEEGSMFYNNLTEVLVNFQNKTNDFCFARKTEKDELVKDLQKNIVTTATQPSPLQRPSNEASKPKPARPPPPKSKPANIAPPNWNVPVSMAPHQMNMPQGQPEAQVPYPTHPSYPYPYPAAPYMSYGQVVTSPFPPAPGYQGQPHPPTGSYPYPPAQQRYPYPQQQYRPQ